MYISYKNKYEITTQRYLNESVSLPSFFKNNSILSASSILANVFVKCYFCKGEIFVSEVDAMTQSRLINVLHSTITLIHPAKTHLTCYNVKRNATRHNTRHRFALNV